MIQIRISRPEDVTRQRELWRLAFGDEGAYVDNFYRTYYRPERMLLLEEDGEVQAMTAWFDTTFVVPERGRYRAAYLYAVATHPEARGRGLAGQLLAGADRIFREWDIPAVTTVPAEPSLHRFFGRNGFRECFVDGQFSLPRNGRATLLAGAALERLSPGEYRDLREELLAGTAHIDLPREALAYQAGACALAPGGGLYAVQTPHGRAALCAEGMESGELVQAVCRRLKPACVVAVDALASRSLKRLCRTVQLSDTGIAPGSGVGNHRAALDRASLGAPVLAVGVPTVVDGATLAADLLGTAELPPLGEGRDLLVTPKDIDSQVSDMAKVIGYGIGLALHPGLRVEDLDLLLS